MTFSKVAVLLKNYPQDELIVEDQNKLEDVMVEELVLVLEKKNFEIQKKSLTKSQESYTIPLIWTFRCT